MDKLKLDIQKFALDPPMAGNIIDEVCLHRYHQNIKRDFAKKGSDNNFSASQSITGDLTVSGDITNHVLDLFNDTSGSNWQDMMKNKLDYCINNINTTKVNAETFINGGWNGVNYGFGIFSKTGDTYQLVWFSSNATYYCRKIGNNYDYTNITRQEIYSTTETIIGTWIDGKTLYRKVVSDTVSTTNGAWKEFNPFSSNEIDTVVSLVGTFTYASGATVSIPYTRTTGSNYSDREYILANVHKYNGTLSVVAYHPSNYSGLMSGQKFRIIIEYTKN